MPLRSRAHLIPRGNVQVTMLYRLHPWVVHPEAIIHTESGQASAIRDPADQWQRDKYQDV